MRDFNIEYKDIITHIEQAPAIQSLLELRKVKAPIIMYGLGEQATLLLAFCNYYSIQIAGFADGKKRGEFDNRRIAIMSPDELFLAYPNANILISSWKYNKEIFDTLIQLGYREEQIYKFPFSHPYFLLREFFETHYLVGYKRAFEFFKDDLSKKIILDRIRAYLYDELLVKTSNKPKYFEFPFADKEVFVQAGTYCGETVKEFLGLYSTEQNYEIYSFEADPQAYEISKNALSNFKNINLINKGLWGTETILTFYTDALSGGASFVNGHNNEIQTPVTSLDTFFMDKPTSITFIQLDIEGAELEALKGAEQIIRNQKPKLAICVYHKYEDVYEIPELLYQYNPEYKFWLQHCEDGIYDTVLYAM